MSSDVPAYYLGLFATRTDAYATWSGEHWTAVRADLTPEVIHNALTRQAAPVSGYMITPANTTHVLAYDFDTETGASEAARVAQAMVDDGVPAYIEGSRRGAHIWSSLLSPVPAKTARYAMRSWISNAGLDPKNPKIELRPGQDEVYPDDDGRPGLGLCLRLPLMPHPKTGVRYPLTDANGEKLGDTIADILLTIEPGDPQKVYAAAARYVPPFTPADVPSLYRRVRAPLPDDDSASEILRSLWGVHNAAPGRVVRCPAHDDRQASLSILRDDQRVICRGVASGCILSGADGRGRGTFELRKLAPVAHAASA